MNKYFVSFSWMRNWEPLFWDTTFTTEYLVDKEMLDKFRINIYESLEWQYDKIIIINYQLIEQTDPVGYDIYGTPVYMWDKITVFHWPCNSILRNVLINLWFPLQNFDNIPAYTKHLTDLDYFIENEDGHFKVIK